MSKEQKKLKGHKRKKQKEKVETTNLLLLEVLKRLPYTRWC
jgi:hypothetical protein